MSRGCLYGYILAFAEWWSIFRVVVGGFGWGYLYLAGGGWWSVVGGGIIQSNQVVILLVMTSIITITSSTNLRKIYRSSSTHPIMTEKMNVLFQNQISLETLHFVPNYMSLNCINKIVNK